jgi:hypothetical protein
MTERWLSKTGSCVHKSVPAICKDIQWRRFFEMASFFAGREGVADGIMES